MELGGVVQVDDLRDTVHRPEHVHPEVLEPHLLRQDDTAQHKRNRSGVRALHTHVDRHDASAWDIDRDGPARVVPADGETNGRRP